MDIALDKRQRPEFYKAKQMLEEEPRTIACKRIVFYLIFIVGIIGCCVKIMYKKLGREERIKEIPPP